MQIRLKQPSSLHRPLVQLRIFSPPFGLGLVVLVVVLVVLVLLVQVLVLVVLVVRVCGCVLVLVCSYAHLNMYSKFSKHSDQRTHTLCIYTLTHVHHPETAVETQHSHSSYNC